MAKKSTSIKSTSKSEPTQDAKEVLDLFDKSWKYAQTHHHARWERNRKLYNNERHAPSYKGITNTFVPLTFGTVETITAALCGGRPSIDFVPQDMYKYIESYASTGKKPDLKALNAEFDYYWDCDNWDLTSIKTVRGTLNYGLAAEYIYWDGDKPRIINLGIRDLIVDPDLSDPMRFITDAKNTFGGRRYLTTLNALKAEKVVDPETGELKPRFKNLQNIEPGFSSGDFTDKQQKEMKLGATGTSNDGVEVIEIIDGDRIRSVAQRARVIEDRENPLGIINIALNRFIADESVIYGKAITDPIAQQQELLNDITNQGVDAVTDQLNPQWELDPAYVSWLPKIKNQPGTVYPFRAGSLNQIEKNPVSPQSFNERQNIKNEIREATGADQVVQGVGDSGDATATEINAQLSQAGQRFELYVRMLEREGFYMRAKIVYKMMLHYLKDPQLVPTTSQDGPKYRLFDPSQFDETYEPKIQLEASVKNNRRREQQEAIQAFQMIIADPTNDLWEAKKVLYPKMTGLSEEELDRIIGQQKPQAPAAPMGPEGAPIEGEVIPEQPTEQAAFL